MRCGCASSRGLVAGKVLERGMGQRVSPLRIVRLSTDNKQQQASICVPSGFQTTRDLRRLVQTGIWNIGFLMYLIIINKCKK